MLSVRGRCKPTQTRVSDHMMDSFQRHFLIPFSTVPSRASKTTLDGQSRADVMYRCIVSSLLISGSTRSDSCIACVLLGTPGLEPATLLCCGQHMRALQPTEKTVAGILQRALPPAPGHPGDLQELEAQGQLNNYEGKRNCCQGTWLRPGGTSAALSHLLTPALSGPHPVVLILQEGSEPITAVLSDLMSDQHNPPPSSVITVLGDDAGLTPSQRDDITSAVDGAGARLVYAGLGPMQLLASQCISLVHHYLDVAVGPSDISKPKFDPNDPLLDKIRPCRICFPPGLLELEQQQQEGRVQAHGQG